MTERGLLLDLRRIAEGQLDDADACGSMARGVYRCPVVHRMHTVCATLCALGYTSREWPIALDSRLSAWRLTAEGEELLSDLERDTTRRERLWRK